MARLITGGADMFAAMAYAPPDQETVDYCREGSRRFRDRLGERANEFYRSVEETYRMLDRSDVMRMARAAGRRASSMWQRDAIRHLTTLGELQNPPERQRRWMMAEPETRRMYHRGQCSGYQGDYIDLDPSDVGVDHYDYRRVTQGVIRQQGDQFIASTYIETLRDKEDELDLDEQDDIMSSWAYLRHALMYGNDDPTSKYNASI